MRTRPAPGAALPVLLALLLLACQPALAWSRLGHRMVGAIAERHLDPAARAQVRMLLAGEPDPTLAGVATWADELRASSPGEYKRTSPWHYIDFPPGRCAYDPARDCPDGNCVVEAIAAQQRILADPAQPPAARRDALKFLVHFVGDVHQPLHAGDHDDRGGNDFQVSLRTDIQPEAYARERYVDGVMGTNLHAVWDYYILASPGLGLDAYVERLDALPWPPVTPPVTGAAAWAGESCRLTDQPGFYPAGHKLDRRYLDDERPLAEQRIRQAAWRLVQLLDASLSPPHPDR